MSRRFLITYIALAIVVLASLEIPLGIQNGRSERRDLTGRIEQDALLMATFAEDSLERGLTKPPPALVRIARRYQEHPGGRVVIVDANGLSLLDTNPPFPGRRSFASRPEFASALQGHIATGERYSKTLRTNLIYVAVPVASGGVIRGAVRITYPTATLDARIQRYWLLLGATGGVVLLLATVVGVQFARTLTRPLSQLERTAAAVGAGDLQARASTTAGPPEVRTLASQFNQTVSRLDGLLRSQREFVADASHQLRTPLAALRLRLENLERDVNNEGKPSLEGALAEVNRLGHLVEALLTLARADASGPNPEPTDLHALVAARLDAWSEELTAHGVALETDVPEGIAVLATPGSTRAGARQPHLQRRSRPRPGRPDHASRRARRRRGEAARARHRTRHDPGAALTGARSVLARRPRRHWNRSRPRDREPARLVGRRHRRASGCPRRRIGRRSRSAGSARALRADGRASRRARPGQEHPVTAARIAVFVLIALAVAVAANLVLLGIANGPNDPVGQLSPRAGIVKLPTTMQTTPTPPTTRPLPPSRQRGEGARGAHQDD